MVGVAGFLLVRGQQEAPLLPVMTILKLPVGESTPAAFSGPAEAGSISGFGGEVYDQD